MTTWVVQPRAGITGSTWTYELSVRNTATMALTVFTHTETAGVTAPRHLGLLKVVFTLQTPDTTTPRNIDDALYVDDIKPGAGVETVWGNWKAIAEGIIPGLGANPTAKQFNAAWRVQDTAAMRSDARKALINGRGWTVTAVHQHQGDGSTLVE